MSFLKKIFKPYSIVFKHVLRKPYTLKYPYERIMPAKGSRGRHVLDLEKCIGCGLCATICPTKAIRIVPRTPGISTSKKAPEIDYGKCCFCSFCVYICPRTALRNTGVFELSNRKRIGLVHSPVSLRHEPSIKDILPMLKKIVKVEVKGDSISYIET